VLTYENLILCIQVDLNFVRVYKSFAVRLIAYDLLSLISMNNI